MSKANMDIALVKEFLSTKKKRDCKFRSAKKPDKVLCAFLVEVKKEVNNPFIKSYISFKGWTFKEEHTTFLQTE